MKRTVCQFPDGKGGFIPHVMDDDGEWHLSDEDGNIIDEEPLKEEGPKDAPSREKPRRAGRKSRQSGVPGSDFHVCCNSETGKKIRDYLRWKAFMSEEYVSSSSMITRMILNHIRKDEEYQSYLKSLKTRK